MSKPLKFRNAYVNTLGNITFLKPAQEPESPVSSSSSSSVSSVKPPVEKSVSGKMQNSTFTSISPAGASVQAAGQVQVITSQGAPALSGSSVIVPQMGSLPVLQNTTNPLQILQRTTFIHGTGKTPAEAGQTFPIVPCVGSTFPATNTVQVIQNQPATNIQIVQNQPSQNIQILQNQPQGSVQILQNPPQGSIQFVQTPTQTQPQANFQVLSGQTPGVQLISNPGQIQGNVQMIQQPALQMVQDQNGRLQLVSSGSLQPVITLPNNTNTVPQQNIPPSSDVKLKDGNLLQPVQAIAKDIEASDKSKVKKTVNASKSGVLRQLLTPKFGTSGLKKAEYKISTDDLFVRRKIFRRKKKKEFKILEKTSAKLPELLPKKSPPLEKSNFQKRDTSAKTAEADKANPEGSGLKNTSTSEASSEGIKRSDEKAEPDEDVVVIINKEQQFDNSEHSKLSFAGTSVKPKFAIEFSPNNLQAYVQAVANAVENHKALFEQNKSDTKHKKKKSKHKSKDIETDFELVYEPPTEVATVSKSSRRKQTLSVRKDPSDLVTAVAEFPKIAPKKKPCSLLSPSHIVRNMDKATSEPPVEKGTSKKKAIKTVSSGSIVSMTETAEDVCIDVVEETQESRVQHTVPREVGVFIPQSLSKSIVGTTAVGPEPVGGAKKVGDSYSQPKSGQSAVSGATKTSSAKLVKTVETGNSSAELAVSCGTKASSTKLKEVNLPVPVDKIKTEPKEDAVSKPQKGKSSVDTMMLKSLLAGDVVKGKTVPSSPGHNKTLKVSETPSVMASLQRENEGKKNPLPVPIQSIKEEPYEIVEISPVKHKSSKESSTFGSGKRVILAPASKNTLQIPIATSGMKPASQQSSDQSLKSKLKDKLLEAKSVSHHYTPVKEATALQKVFTAIAQETQASKVNEVKNDTNLKSPQQTISKQKSLPKTVAQQIADRRSPKPQTFRYLEVPKVASSAPAYSPVAKVVQLGYKPDALCHPLVKTGELVQPVTSTVLPPQIALPQNLTAGSSSASSSTKNIAKLMGPFTLMPNSASVPNLPVAGNANQQKQVFIVPNSLYSALLSAQASTGKTVQLTSSQLFSGKVLPPAVTSVSPSTLISASTNSGNSVTPQTATTVPASVNLIANQDMTSPVTIADNAKAQPSPVQQSSGLSVTDAVRSPLQGKQSQSEIDNLKTIADMSSPLNIPLPAVESAKRLMCSPKVAKTKNPTSNAVQPAQVGSDDNVELGKPSLELKIDSVFSLNKVSCKLLDKVPSYLDMCLNSEHERSLKLCFVVLDRKMPPMFRGKSGTKRTRLVVPKACPTQCRTDALDSMCGKKRYEEDLEPVIKRAKPGRPRKKVPVS